MRTAADALRALAQAPSAAILGLMLNSTPSRLRLSFTRHRQKIYHVPDRMSHDLPITSPRTTIALVSPASPANPQVPPRSSPTWQGAWVLATIMAAACALRLIGIGAHGLFGDEIYSVQVADGTADPELAFFDSPRPVYFALLRLWMLAGSSEEWLRMLSALFALFTVALTYRLGAIAAGPCCGLAAALICALSPMEVHYSQQVRMYTLGTCLTLAGSTALLSAFCQEKARYVYAWAALRLFGILTLPLTAVLLVADLLVTAWRRPAGRLKAHAVLGLALALLGVLPAIVRLPDIAASPYDAWRRGLPAPAASDMLALLVNFTTSAYPLQECKGPPVDAPYVFIYVLLVPLLLLLAVFSGKDRLALVPCAIWAACPIALAFVFSQFSPSLFITRYLMFTAPYVYVLIARGWRELWGGNRPAALAAAALYAITVGSCLHFYYSHPVHEDWREIAAYITRNEKPGDQIAIWNYHARYPFRYYYKGDAPVHDLIVKPKAGHAGFEIEAALAEPAHGARRLWIIHRNDSGYYTETDPWAGPIRSAIFREFAIVRGDRLGRMDIYLASPGPIY